MGRISPETIAKIREAARVEEVIAEFVPLKRAGSNLKGFSPFNLERQLLFMVSPAKQIWKDFSSGKGGDVVKFLMEHEGYSYPEALRWLAEKYNIEIEERELTEEDKLKADERESLMVVLDFARKWFMEQLYETDEGKSVGLSYMKERGFLEKTLRKYEVGYSPARVDAFYKSALEKGYKEEWLEKAGLIIKKNNRVIDRFFGRVIFPIHQLSGRVIAFAGRILDNSKKAAKYINSPETEVYHKSKVLYGLYQAKQAISRENVCYLTEGYTDVMSFHQAGIENTVASAGTSLTHDQIRLIKRFTPNVVLVFDGDPAGIRAAMRGVDMILENDMNVEVVVLPQGEDPDSFAKKTPTEELIAYLENNKQDFIKFKTDFLLGDEKDPIKVFDLISDVLESIAGIPNQIKRELYIREVAQMTGTAEKTLYTELTKVLRRKYRQKYRDFRSELPEMKVEPSEPQLQHTDRRKVLERELIRLLLLYGNETVPFKAYRVKDVIDNDLVVEEVETEEQVARKIFLELQEDEVEFNTPEYREIFNKIWEHYSEENLIDLSKLMYELDERSLEVISDIMMEEEKYKLSDWEKKNISLPDKIQVLSEAVTDTIYNLRLLLVENLIDKELEEARENKKEEKQDFWENIKLYFNLRKLLAHYLQRVV